MVGALLTVILLYQSPTRFESRNAAVGSTRITAYYFGNGTVRQLAMLANVDDVTYRRLPDRSAAFTVSDRERKSQLRAAINSRLHFRPRRITDSMRLVKEYRDRH